MDDLSDLEPEFLRAMEHTRWDLLELAEIRWVNKEKNNLLSPKICEVCDNEFCQEEGSVIHVAVFRFMENHYVEAICLYVCLGRLCAADLERAIRRAL